MSDEAMSEPTRWLDDPGAAAGLRADLAQVAGARVVGLDHAAGLAALRGAIAIEPAAGLASATKAAGGKALGTKTLGLVGGLALGVVAAGWLALGNPSTPQSPAVAAPVADAAPVAAVQSPAPAARPAPAAKVIAPAPEPEAEAVVITDDDDVPGTDVEAVRAKERRAVRDEVARPSGRERESETTVSPDASRYLEEAKLVARARKQLNGDPAAALALTKQHAREYPEGALVEERRALSIRALAQLGRMDEARAEADAFLATSGDGPYAQAVRRAIAGTDSPN